MILDDLSKRVISSVAGVGFEQSSLITFLSSTSISSDKELILKEYSRILSENSGFFDIKSSFRVLERFELLRLLSDLLNLRSGTKCSQLISYFESQINDHFNQEDSEVIKKVIAPFGFAFQEIGFLSWYLCQGLQRGLKINPTDPRFDHSKFLIDLSGLLARYITENSRFQNILQEDFTAGIQMGVGSFVRSLLMNNMVTISYVAQRFDLSFNIKGKMGDTSDPMDMLAYLLADQLSFDAQLKGRIFTALLGMLEQHGPILVQKFNSIHSLDH